MILKLFLTDRIHKVLEKPFQHKKSGKLKIKSPPLPGFEPTTFWGQKHARKLRKRTYLGRAWGDKIVPCFEQLDNGLKYSNFLPFIPFLPF